MTTEVQRAVDNLTPSSEGWRGNKDMFQVIPITHLPSPLLSLDEHHWSEDVDEIIVIEAAREIVTPAEFRIREELDLLSRQWKSILGTLFILAYMVLMVFLNLAYYRYEPPENGRRLKDLGFELIPELPEEFGDKADIPLMLMAVYIAVVLFGTTRMCFPCRRGSLGRDSEIVPYIVNITRRFGLAFAAGHCLRALTYLVTTIPGGNSKCLSTASLAQRPTLAQCFYHTASVTSNCGDLMFSGHLLLSVLLLCVANRYVGAALGLSLKGRHIFMSIGIFLTICEFFMIIAARHHYTSDCVVALYFTPTLWLSLEYYNPHDQVPDRLHIARTILDKAKLCLVSGDPALIV